MPEVVRSSSERTTHSKVLSSRSDGSCAGLAYTQALQGDLNKIVDKAFKAKVKDNAGALQALQFTADEADNVKGQLSTMYNPNEGDAKAHPFRSYMSKERRGRRDKTEKMLRDVDNDMPKVNWVLTNKDLAAVFARCNRRLKKFLTDFHRSTPSSSESPGVIIVGGAAKGIGVKKTIAEAFPGCNVHVCDPMETVARGALLYAQQHRRSVFKKVSNDGVQDDDVIYIDCSPDCSDGEEGAEGQAGRQTMDDALARGMYGLV